MTTGPLPDQSAATLRELDADVVGALEHCRVRSNWNASPEGFQKAKALGLLAQDPVWRTTARGDGVLIAAGLLDGEPAAERVCVHALWARHSVRYAPSQVPQFVAAFADGLVDCWSESYEDQRGKAEQWYRDFFEPGEVESFFTTVEYVDRPEFPKPEDYVY
jgi:hypothetical protein